MAKYRYCARCRTYHKYSEECPNRPKKTWKPKDSEQDRQRRKEIWKSVAYMIRTQRDDNRCQLCARELLRTVNEFEKATEVHHIVPLADGGDLNDPENLKSLCHWHHQYVEGKDEYKELLKQIAKEQNEQDEAPLIG